MRRSILLSTATAAVAIALASPPVLAEVPTDVEEIIVTAARLPLPVDDVPGARVIDAAEIEARGAVVAADILADVPGLSLYRNGAFGGVTSVRMRGASADKTLVLVDGVALNDPSQPSGGFDFAGFDLADIERVEILSGPQGSLWGSDAIGGVIAFTTREPDGFRADLEAGSLNSARVSASAGVARDAWAVGLSVASFDTDGVSKADARDGNSERDGFRNRAVGASGRAAVTPWLVLDARFRFSDSHADLDGYPAPAFVLADTDEVSTTRNRSGFLRARLEGPWGFEHELLWGASDIDRRVSGGAFPSHYVGERRQLRWQASHPSVTDGLGLAFGVEREETKGDLSTGAAAARGATSGFAVARAAVTPRLDLSGSLRLDDPDDYDAEATGRLAASWRPGGGWRLAAAWGQGFKTPTISQTVCDFCFSAAPFPVLRPERAEGFDAEAGWRSADGRFDLRLGGWRLEIEDQIVYDFDPVTFESVYRNLARTRSDGVELEGRAGLGAGFELRAAYAWTDARDVQTGARLLLTPEHAGFAALDWAQGPWRAGVRVRAEGEQADVGGLRDGFFTADLNGAWAVTEQVELTVRVGNLFDERYQEALGYGEPGRTGWLGVRLRY